MSRLTFFAVIVSFPAFLNGCQKAQESDESPPPAPPNNAVAQNEAQSQPEAPQAGAGMGQNQSMDDVAEEDLSGESGGEYGMEEDPGLDETENAGAGYGGFEDFGPDGTEDAGAGYGGFAEEMAADGTEGDLDFSGYGDVGPEGDPAAGAGDYGAGYGVPGAEGDPANGPGYGGAGGPGSGGPPKYPEGSAANAVVQVVLKIAEGKQEGLEEFISPRAQGELAALRSGTLAADELEKLKTQMAQVRMLGKPRTSGTTKTITLQNKEGRLLKFTCRKEGEKYLIREFENREPPRRRPRRY